jgi:NodT family efflux transporter outer membrane factor (OMF) lipoprotein
MSGAAWRRLKALITVTIVLALGGCTSPCEYLRNGFKVGPNLGVPAGATAPGWIDQSDVRVRGDCVELNQWWTLFQDPTLDRLIANASSQNLTLREAGFRVLEARAQLGISRGELFPQSQSAFGAYQRGAASTVSNYSPGISEQFFDQWNFGFNLNWELDFWGRFRRAITAAERSLDASCANYNDVLVTLLGDVASNYVQVRTLQQRIEFANQNVERWRNDAGKAEHRRKVGIRGLDPVDVPQAHSNLAQAEAQIPQLRMAVRQACNRLCVLLGIPTCDLERELGVGPIPTAPSVIAIGIPAELLTRRPDVRRAQHMAEVQAERIGIAETDLYPIFAITGTLGWNSENLPELFTSGALNSSVGPAFQWNILNYGRIRNNMRVQDAKFWQLVYSYQNTVLRANAEVEDGLAMFLRAQERTRLLDTSVDAAKQAAGIMSERYEKQAERGPHLDYTRVVQTKQDLAHQQDLLAQSCGEIAQGLIQVYRALGGGWQVMSPGSEPRAAGPAPAGPLPQGPGPASSPEAPKPPTPPVPIPSPPDAAKSPLPPAARASSSGVAKAPLPPAARTSRADVAKAPCPPAPARPSPQVPKAPFPPTPRASSVVAKAPLPPAARTAPADVAKAPDPPAPAAPSPDTPMAPFPPAPTTSGSASVFVAGLNRLER